MSETGFTPELAASTELERRFNLREQYEQQKRFLMDSGLAQLLPSSGEVGILDIDGVERPIPSYESVRERLEADKETYLAKAEQGFTRLQLTPFGLPINDFVTRYSVLLKQRKAEGKLLSQTGEPLKLDTDAPVWIVEEFLEQDDPAAGDGIVYNVTQFSTDNHGGQTKRQILADQATSSDPWTGWEVDLKESTPIIPRQGANEVIGGRKRWETNQTPIEYLGLLQDAKRAAANPDAMRQELAQFLDPAAVEMKLTELLSYAGEAGETIEGWFTYALEELHTNNRVIDDWTSADTGALCFLIGSFYPAVRCVPRGRWDRGNRQANVDGDVPEDRFPYCGSRSRVRVKRSA